MSAFTMASVAVALPVRASASTRRASASTRRASAAQPARVNLSGARLASAPARAAGRDRGDSLVVRMSSNPNLDRENPDLEEKFAVIG
jgi:hypothetical protein